MNLPKDIVILALLAASAYAGLVGFMYLSQRTMLYPGAGGGDLPAGAAWGAVRTIETPDGETLTGYHAPAESRRPTLLFFHGNADSIVNYGFLAEALKAEGFGLLAVSYRGYAGSTGRPSETGLLTDGLAAYDWLAERAPGGIVVMGQSLGSGVAVNTAAERPALGIVLVSAYDSMLALAKRHYPYLPVGPLIKDTYRSDMLIGNVSAPKLFLHGRLDDIVPLVSGEALFAAAPEPRTMKVYDAYGHNDLWDEDDVVADIVSFMEMLGSN